MKILKKMIILFFVLYVSFYPVFALTVSNSPVFNDVDNSHPNYAAILDLQSRGIISGYSDGSFKPDRNVSRAEALKIILLGSGFNVQDAPVSSGFEDVKDNAWYSKFISKAKSLFIIQGYFDNTFRPDKTVTLAEGLKILLSAKQVNLSEFDGKTDLFNDVYSSDWYAKHFQYAREKNLVDCDDQCNVYPAGSMTRAKLADIMYRFIYIQENKLSSFPFLSGKTPSASDFPASPYVPKLPVLPPPDLNDWLLNHPKVANSIKWQYRSASMTNAYFPPSESDKIVWADWTEDQKYDLDQAYIGAYTWFANGAFPVEPDHDGISDQPENITPNAEFDEVTGWTAVNQEYMWDLYVHYIAFSLAEEIGSQLPWSILDYSDEELRYLFDSTTMAWNIFEKNYSMGTYANKVPEYRSSNLPQTSFASPMWTYTFLKESNLLGSTRRENIGALLGWMRSNMAHFYGADTFSNYESVWQYRGFPPLSKIVEGTVDVNNPSEGIQHWTAGCHGSVGFISAVLRAENIPVQPVWICGHELVYFMTEDMYMDHGDVPYNMGVKNSKEPMLSFLIDDETYKLRFSSDLSVNVTDDSSPACVNVGRSTTDL